MKRLFICFLLSLFLFSACQSSPNSTNHSESTSMNATVTTDSNMTTTSSDSVHMDIAYEYELQQKTEHFELYGADNGGACYYTVVADSGIILDWSYDTQWYRIEFSEEDSVGCLKQFSGGPTCSYRFYDFVNERVSRIYENPFTRNGNLVATIETRGDELVLLVQDMFDPSVYQAVFREDWIVPFLVIQNAKIEFIENNTKLKVSYLEDETNLNKTVVLELP